MNWARLLLALACSAVLGASTFAQDDLLGKKGGGKKGGGGDTQSGGSGGSKSGGSGGSGGTGGSGGSKSGGSGGSSGGSKSGGSTGGSVSGGGGSKSGGSSGGDSGLGRGSSGGSKSSGGSSGGGVVIGGGSGSRSGSSGSGSSREGWVFQGGGNDDLLQRRPPARSGRTQYGTVNNDTRVSQAQSQIQRAPIDLKSGTLEYQVRRQEQVRLNQPYRSGYYHYDRRWRDDYFVYPYYVFTPIYDRCVVSPWYYYPHLPAYLVTNRVTIINIGGWNIGGTIYNWRRPNWYDNRGAYYGSDNRFGYSDLDLAIDDLVTGFERADSRSLGRLIPRQGRINIALEGRYAYSVNADDFYDMLIDASLSTRTVSYQVVEVRTNRFGADVVARHEYVDPWGRRSQVYHFYRLQQDRGGFFITDFGTSTYRW